VSAIDLNRIQKNVLSICIMHPEAVNDRSMLLDIYWHSFDGWNDSQSLYWNLSKATRPETILRRLREIREMGLIKEAPEVEQKNLEAMQNERMRVKDNWAPAAQSWLDD